MLTSLLLAVLSALPGQRTSYEIAEWVAQSTDCGTPYQTAGVAGPNPICDLAPALRRIQAHAKETMIPSWPQRTGNVSVRIHIPAGVYELRSTVEFCRAVHLVGDGGGFESAATLIRVPRGQDALRFMFYTGCVASGAGEGSNGSVVEDLGLQSYTVGSTSAPSAGIRIFSRVLVRNVLVAGFVQGIVVAADVHQQTNANLTVVDHARLVSNEHAGIIFAGGDSNAGGATFVDSMSNCQRGSYWKAALGVCANVIEKSFLGNTFIGMHTAAAKDRVTAEVFQGYLFDGASQRSVCVGCYSEHDQLVGALSPNSNALAGMSGWSGHGAWQFGPRINTLVIRNELDPANVVDISFGRAINMGGTYAAFSSFGDSTFAWPLRLKLDKPRRAWKLDVGNLTNAVPFMVGATSGSPGGYGGLVLPQPVYLGSPAIPVQVVSSTTALAQPCAVGTESILRIPQAGKDGRAVCVVGGTWESRP